ncbi:MAG: Gfo/Idh/MocA family protein [Bryobacteraceae bacterium]
MFRRHFLAASAAAVASQSRLGAATNAVQVGVVGLGGRGRELLAVLAEEPGCRVTAVCDIDQARAEEAAQLAAGIQHRKLEAYSDIRRMLESKDVDAIVIATCNHWHALATIWGCQAGKDVYVEKPASHNLWEGRRMIDAARRYNRIVQVGMQGRTIEHRRQAIDLLHQGAIGKVYMAKGLCFKRRKSIGRKGNSPVPPGVDYDLWLGPAEKRPFNPNRFHYNWHWFWDTGNGDIGNQGPHQMDLAVWGLGKNRLPKAVFSSGAKFAYDDDQETPNTQLAIFEYEDCKLVFEVRGLLTPGEGSIAFDSGNFIGNLFLGTEGYMCLDQNGFQVYLGDERQPAQQMNLVEAKPDDPAPHLRNFLDAVRSRRSKNLNAGIEDGHLAAALCHLANVSYRLGRRLDIDPAVESVVGDEEAQRLLTRQYRSPFVVPEKV